MNIASMKIGTRLGVGFGFILIVMATLILLALTRLEKIEASNNDMIENDWVMYNTGNLLKEKIQANVRKTLELLVTTDKASDATLRGQLRGGLNAIDDAIAKLEKMAEGEEKPMLAQIRDAYAKYVASTAKVGKLVADDQREEAAKTMQTEALPSLLSLERAYGIFMDLQIKQVEVRPVEVRQNIELARILLLSLGLPSLLIGIGFAAWITRSITRPMKQAVSIAQTVASGDLTSIIVVKSSDETGQLMKALKEMNESLVQIVGKVRAGTDAIATASGQIASGNLDLSSRTEQQAGSLEQTASSMEELTGTVKQNADNARQANVLAVSASGVAVKGGQVVSQVVDTMNSINESSKMIVDIIAVIDGIAFQTNILALNAAVEAARAGEQGRGFAVVAAEVRSLAQRSANAAKEIKTLIGDSVERIEVGSKLVNQAGSTMSEIVESIRRVTDIMGEITAASQEQTSDIEQISQEIGQIDEVTQQNAALVEEAAAATESLQQQAENLSQVVSVFKLDGVIEKKAIVRNSVKTPDLAVDSLNRRLLLS